MSTKKTILSAVILGASTLAGQVAHASEAAPQAVASISFDAHGRATVAGQPASKVFDGTLQIAEDTNGNCKGVCMPHVV
ncbi:MULTISPECIES: hypothetical protein [Acetobacter]|uniref:hypothetical protein n=1 Tax=Acetobacter TaxID=434 RepID=UPI0011201544|nr:MULTISPECIES: hypothetical protein [Acetobacter]MCG4274371.1 hypothetical protein [Acetobacter senegalensis]